MLAPVAGVLVALNLTTMATGVLCVASFPAVEAAYTVPLTSVTMPGPGLVNVPACRVSLVFSRSFPVRR